MASEEDERVRAWHAGDAKAGRALIRRYFPGLYRFFAAKLDDKDAVADLVQRTFAALLRTLGNYDPARGSFRAYLFGVARHELIAELRARAGGGALAPLQHSIADLATTPSMHVARRERSELLVAALRSIPVEFQIVLELHYWEGMSVVEVAQALEISDGTVKSRLSRGRSHLRRVLQEMAPGTVEAWEAELRATGERLTNSDPGSTRA